MKYIKTYKIFEAIEDFKKEADFFVPNRPEEAEYPSDKDETEFDLEKYGITDCVVDDDLVVDVNTDVFLDDYSFYDLPFYFNKINGDFVATRCKLVSFIGLPKFVNGILDVSFNNLMEYDISYFPVAKSYNFEDNDFEQDVKNFIESEIRVVKDYGIWNIDGSLNEKRLEMYQKEFKNPFE